MSHEFRFHEDMARKSREQLETDLREAEKDRDEYKRRWKESERLRAKSTQESQAATALAAPSNEQAPVLTYHRNDKGEKANEAYAAMVVCLSDESRMRLANLLAHGVRATLGPRGVALTREDWKSVELLPLASPQAAPAQSEPAELLRMVIEDMEICWGERGSEYAFQDLSTETVEAIVAHIGGARPNVE